MRWAPQNNEILLLENEPIVHLQGTANYKSSTIRQIWQELSAQNPNFYDGPITEVQQCLLNNHQLTIEVLESMYSRYLADRHGLLDKDEHAQSLAVNAVPLTKDGFVLLACTSLSSESAGQIKFFGGATQPSDFTSERPGSLRQAMKRELLEEFPQLLQFPFSTSTTKIIAINQEHVLLILFVLRLSVNLAEIPRGIDVRADPDQEITDWWPVALNEAAVTDFLHTEEVPPLPYVEPALRFLISCL